MGAKCRDGECLAWMARQIYYPLVGDAESPQIHLHELSPEMQSRVGAEVIRRLKNLPALNANLTHKVDEELIYLAVLGNFGVKCPHGQTIALRLDPINEPFTVVPGARVCCACGSWIMKIRDGQ